jgi:ElaB/YqjD/DUF883 family membrane-anchored ribosome-binding protein
MDQEPNVIRQQIDQTRSSLTEKLETLENQVLGTVANARSTVEETIQTARSSVEETIQAVRSTVTETVHQVKKTFDLPYQVERHPWAMFGGSLVAGYLTGSLLPKASSLRNGHVAPPVTRQAMPIAPSLLEPSRGETAVRPQPSWFSKVLHQFEEEIEQAKELAIGAAVGVVRDLAKQALPQFSDQIHELMAHTATKLGGKPIEQPLVQPATAERSYSGARYS